MTMLETPSRNKVAQFPELDAYFVTFSSWLESTGNRGRGRSERTVNALVSDISQFAGWFTRSTEQRFRPELITSHDLRGYFTFSKEVERCAPATWNRRRVSLGLFCSWAVEFGAISYNPFQGVPVMEEPQLAPRGLTNGETLRFLRRVEQAANTARTEIQRKRAIRNRAMIALMIYAGMREGEVCALTASDLLLSNRKGTATAYNAKGNVTRNVPLGNEVRIALSAWIEIHGNEGPVFDGITERQVQRVVGDIGKECGLVVTPHMLRHTFAYRARGKGVSEVVLQKIMGHARLETTGRYGSPRQEDLQAAVENL